MIDFLTFKAKIKDAINEMQVSYMGKKALEKLKAHFIFAMDENTDLKLALPNFYGKFIKLDNQDSFLAAIPKAVNDVLKPYLSNEFAHILSQFLGEEENIDEIDALEIQARFSVNLITHLNKVLVRCFGDELENCPVEFEELVENSVVEMVFRQAEIRIDIQEAVVETHNTLKNELTQVR